MSLQPNYTDWKQLVTLVKNAVEHDQHDMLLMMMTTPDERESLIARANILYELLKGEHSQREISQLLGVGIATVTRGSNELKTKSEQHKEELLSLLTQSF